MTSAIPYTDNPQQQTESQVFTIPFASAPEIYGENTFILDKNPNILLIAENLASEAKYLINILNTIPPSDIQNQFQIELRKIDTQNDECSSYKMSLRIDSVLWFKHHAPNDSNEQSLEQLYEIGSHYVEKVKNETGHYPAIKNEREIVRIPISSSTSNWCHVEQKGRTCPSKDDQRHPCPNKHYQWCPDENYGVKGKCASITGHTQFIHTSRIKEDDKSAYQCRHRSTKLNRKEEFCLFCVDPNFWIYHNEVVKPSCYPYFIVAARSDAIPVITLNPVKHCRNEEYVQTGDAWQAVLQTLIYMKEQLKLDKLPLSRIYVNFGKWMQQKVDDPKCRDCHAHINIVLTRQTIEKINDINLPKDGKRKGGKLFQSLVGSVLPPKTYRLDDSLKLIDYMNNHMTPRLIKQNRELVRSISTLKAEIEKLKEENENLRQMIFGPTQDAQEVDDSANRTDMADVGTGINDEVSMQDSFLNSNNE